MKIVMIGLSGSGKSYISSILERCGYHWLRTDAIRKELFGSIYDESVTQKVYQELIKRASKYENAVLDGAFLKAWQRKIVLEAFKDYIFIHVKTSDEVAKKRIRERIDISDADLNVFYLQKSTFEPPDEIQKDRIIEIDNTNASKESILNLLKAKNLC